MVEVRRVQRRLLWAALVLCVFVVTGPTIVGAQVVPFPQVQQSWTYRMTGEAEFDAPLDAVLSYSATVQYSLTGINSESMNVTQGVWGNVVWPSQSGSGVILLGKIDYSGGEEIHYSASNTSFDFETRGIVRLNDSKVSGVDDEGFSVVGLVWSSASSTVGFFVGLTWVAFRFPEDMRSVYRPTVFFIPGCHTMVYWNTGYAPWGNVYPYWEYPWVFDGAPIHAATDQWAVDFVSTPYGERQALKNVTTISVSGFPGADVVVSSWIDAETGLLLKLTEDLSASGLQFRYVGIGGVSTNSTQSTRVELVACNLWGVMGYLLWNKIYGVSLLSVLVISGVLVLACLTMGMVSRSVLSKPKRETNR
jgi:hypothetical protein